MQKARVLAIPFLAIALASVWACARSEAPAAATPAAVAAKPPIGFLNTPAEKQVVPPGTFVSGWALAESGIADVTVTFDDGQKAYVRRGDNFPGVAAQYPNYPDADKAGYVFAIPKLSPGTHSLKVIVKSRDGSTVELNRNFGVS